MWVEHFRRGSPELAERLEHGEVLCHPFIIGELACGNLSRRSEILSLIQSLPHTPQLEHEEVMSFVEARLIIGSGIGWIDAHLLASAMLAGVALWTLDRRLASLVRRVGLRPGP